MRDIKFKIWDKKKERWYHSSQLVIRPYSGNVTDGAISLDGFVEVLQYTGIKDMKGIEIYEGDIVEFARGRHQVKFIDGSFALYDRNEWHIPLYTLYGGIEIIGNIYENPKLL